MPAAAKLACSAPLPSASRSAFRTAGRNAVSATLKNTVSTPASRATATSCATVSTPNAHASGTLAISAARPRSATTITGRLGRRSTQTPAGSPTSIQAAVDDALMTPTSKLEACSTAMATSGNATRVTDEPSSLMVCALQSSRKSRCRRTLAIGRGYRFTSGPVAPI
jgi:hypothetical protein